MIVLVSRRGEIPYHMGRPNTHQETRRRRYVEMATESGANGILVCLRDQSGAFQEPAKLAIPGATARPDISAMLQQSECAIFAHSSAIAPDGPMFW